MGVRFSTDELGVRLITKDALAKAMREEEDRALKAPDSGLAGQPKGVNADKGYLA